jgi:hypothetical protein
MRETAQALADALPDGRCRTLEGQTHDVTAKTAHTEAGKMQSNEGGSYEKSNRIGVRDAGWVMEEPSWTFQFWNEEIARFKFDELFAATLFCWDE